MCLRTSLRLSDISNKDIPPSCKPPAETLWLSAKGQHARLLVELRTARPATAMLKGKSRKVLSRVLRKVPWEIGALKGVLLRVLWSPVGAL